LFVDDGVYQLKDGQNTGDVEMKNFSPTYNALGDYDVNKIYVSRESLEERNLTTDDLMALTYEDEDEDYAEKPSIRVIDRDEVAELMEGQDVVLSF